MVLKEKFVWKRDGVAIVTICTGSFLAVSQEKNIIEEIDKDNVVPFGLRKLAQAKAISYYIFVVLLIIARVALERRVRGILKLVYNKWTEAYRKSVGQNTGDNVDELEFVKPPDRLIVKAI